MMENSRLKKAMKTNGHQSNLAPHDLDALGGRVSARVGRAGYCTVAHAAELKILQRLSLEALEEFAREHGLIVVKRMAGEKFEFTRRWGTNL